jgi:serine/threonine protein kinase/predicted ATPase
MTTACPPDAELERLLADQLTEAEEKALEAHVVGCAACQCRLEQLTRGVLTLPAGRAGSDRGPEDTPPPGGVLKGVASFLPAQVRLLVQQPAPNPAASVFRPQAQSEHATRQAAAASDAEGGQARCGPAGSRPEAFGRYQVRGVLGSGGFGSVYLCHDTQLDRPVALKVHRGDRDLAPAEAERLLQEARRLARLRHPGIVTVHDTGIDQGRVYIVSDFLDGPSMEEWLRTNRLNWQEAAGLAAAVADALAHAHARLIVHRDVKPANILLTADRRPVLVDFGLALDEAEAGGQEFGVVSGTPAYMSPEQVMGVAHRIDGRTDVYSLSVVLYETLTGHVPFRSSGTHELLRQVLNDEPQPPRQLVGDLPPDLERICLKGLAKRLQDRYTTAADFAEDLRSVVRTAKAAVVPSPGPSSAAASGPRAAPETPPSQRWARGPERRQVTVLVCGCDLFDSEEFLGQLNAEDQAEVLGAFRQSGARAVRRFGGTVVTCDARGLLACFGYPVAHEDTPRQAAQTGLAILEDIGAVNKQVLRNRNFQLKPWVGIHTGLAVVETGEDAVLLAGEPQNVAFWLKGVAEPGQVICTAATQRLIRGYFECVSLGYRMVKGVPQAVELFWLQAPAAMPNAIEVAERSGLTPLIGRDHEVSLLQDRWEQAREGMGQVVQIVGEPGLGKSRLIYTLKKLIEGQAGEPALNLAGQSSSISALVGLDAPIIEWRCSPHYQNTGLYPACDFFERFLGFGRDEAPGAHFDRLVRHLQAYGLGQPDVVPLFASLLSLPLDERFPPVNLPPVREREERFRVLREWLCAYASRRPVLFVVEDLHWVDASTLQFLAQFLAEGLRDRILTVLTFRPEFQTPWPALAHPTSLALNRLTRRQVGELMRKKLRADNLSESLVGLVNDRTSGVPLFVEEFTKVVQESGLLDRMEGDGARAPALPAHEVPASLQDLVMARLDRLASGPEVARLAAALGREFSYDLLAAVATLEEPALQAELAKLVQGDILYQKGWLPRCSYVFKHALLQDAAYNALVTGKREQVHCRIAEVVEARFPQTAQTQPELLAHHFTEAGVTSKAVDYWLQAGLRSRERSANAEAIGHLTQGLALLATLPESPRRDAQELQFLNALCSAYQAVGGYGASQAEAPLRRARELCERIGQPPELLVVLWGTWAWHINRGNLLLCMALARDAMELAERVNDPAIRMEAILLLGVTMLNRGDFAGSRDASSRALAEYDGERTHFWVTHMGHDWGVAQRCVLVPALWHLGYPDQALKLNRETRELARSIGHPYTMAYAAWCRARLYQLCRLGAEAWAAADELLRIATEQGLKFYHASGTLHQGAGLLLQGLLEEGLSLLRKGLDVYRATGSVMALPYYLSILGAAQVKAGRFAEARQAMDDGLALVAKHDDRFQEAELHRLQGELLLAESESQAAAEDCFHRAIETARRQQSRAWELRATMSLARLWQQQGRGVDARAALTAVHGTYTEGFTTPDLVDATALLQALT